MSSIAEAVQTLADAVARIVVEAVRRELLGEASIAAIRAAIAPSLVAEPAPQPGPKSEPVCQPANAACDVEVSTPSPKTDHPPLPRSEGKIDAVAPRAAGNGPARNPSLPSSDGGKNSAPIKRVRLSAEGMKILFQGVRDRGAKRGAIIKDDPGLATINVLWDGVKTPMTLHRDFVEPADGGRDDPTWEGEDQPVDLPALPKTKPTPIIPKTIPAAPAPTIKDIVERVNMASAERIKAWADGKSSAPEVKAPPPRPKPTPIVTSKVAAALANYTRQRSQVPAPVKPKASPTPEPAYDYENPNARRPRLYGGSALLPTSIHFKPDAPASKRGAVVVAVPGEPPAGRSALDERRREEAERAAKGL